MAPPDARTCPVPGHAMSVRAPGPYAVVRIRGGHGPGHRARTTSTIQRQGITLRCVTRTTRCHAAWLQLVGDVLQGQPGAREFPHAQVADLLLESFGAACCSLNVVEGAWVDHVVAEIGRASCRERV